MASNDLIIDDDYCKAMAQYFEKQGAHLDEAIASYISVMQTVRTFGIRKGDVAKALSAFIQYAEKMRKQYGKISSAASKQATAFITKVDAADQYLF